MFSMRFEGGAEMAATLARMEKKLSKSLQLKALTEAAQPMRDAIEARAPHEPGAPDIKDNIIVSKAKAGDVQDSQEVAVAVGPRKGQYFYGSFQELGTAFHPAQPFVRPGFDETVRESLDVLNDELWFMIRHGEDKF